MSYENIAGYDGLKQLLQKFSNIITNIDEYVKNGLKVPNGILLYGEPGVGKTAMARAFAESCGSYVELRSADCVGSDSVKNVQNAFEKASKNEPAVLFIDELDKIAEESDVYFMESNNSIMKVLLQELDKAKHNSNMVVIATCNNYQGLNKALIRSGRFDNIIQVARPSGNDRVKIIKMYLDKITMQKKVEVEDISKLTNGMTGAEIEVVINSAGIKAYEREDKTIKMDDIREAMSRMISKAIEEDYLRQEGQAHIIAVHEAGHALLSIIYGDGKCMIGASILPQGNSAGRVSSSKIDKLDKIEDIRQEILIALAGKCAEEIVLGESYAGCSSDLKIAYDLANQLIYVYGYKGIRYINPNKLMRPHYFNSEYDKNVGDLLDECYKDTQKILSANRDCYDAILVKLEEKFALSGEEIEQIYKDTLAKRG